MKWILFTLIFSLLLLFSHSSLASTFIGNGGQTGDLELAVSLKQLRAVTERIRQIKETDPNHEFCVCPPMYNDHQLCGIVFHLKAEQKKYCETFISTQLDKLERASNTTQFEWVKTQMMNRNRVGERVVDAVARKDKNLIYIDQSRFLDIDPSKRLFLITHELFHMDTFNGIKLDDEDKIGPFDEEYGVRDLLNGAAAAITLTSIDQTVFNEYTKFLKQSKSDVRHWISVTSSRAVVQDEKGTNFSTELSGGSRWGYQYQFDSFYNFGLLLQADSVDGSKTIFGSARIKQRYSVGGIGVSYRYYLFNNSDPFSHFWNTFVQLEVVQETMHARFDMSETLTSMSSSASSQSTAARINLFIPVKYGFWLNTGIHFSQHTLYFKEFDYKLTSKSPHFFLGATYGF